MSMKVLDMEYEKARDDPCEMGVHLRVCHDLLVMKRLRELLDWKVIVMWWYGMKGGKTIGCGEKMRYIFTDKDGTKPKAMITYDDKERTIKVPWVVSKLLNVGEVIVTDEGLAVPRMM